MFRYCLTEIFCSLDSKHVPEPEATSIIELSKGRNDYERAMVTLARSELDSDRGITLARDSSGRGAGASKLRVGPHNSRGVGREEVCGLLIERLQDVSTCF
jgi:hypothetical protein